jgi:hypothetical protein
MPAKTEEKQSLIIYLAISALLHFIAGYFTPINPTSAPTNNQRIELSWHILQPSTADAQDSNNDLKFTTKQEDPSARKNPVNESSPSRGNPSQALTKKPEMLSEELLFVETDFGYQASGSITFALTIGKDGSVKKAKKMQSTARPMYEDQVLKHILKSTWSPGELNGTPIESNISITIDIGSQQ